MIEFVEFPKIARLSRACVITEKIDGTNAQVHIRDAGDSSLREKYPFEFGVDTQISVGGVQAYIRGGSRSRWLAHGGNEDNFGFGRWVTQNAHDLAHLGFGSHFGEWWGSGIQRGYGLPQGEKRFSLFNTARWSELRPACCQVVPVLYEGLFSNTVAEAALDTLRIFGSAAAPSFANPEGVIIWHEAARIYFKKTLNKDEEYKGKAAKAESVAA